MATQATLGDTAKESASLRRRVRGFYNHLNQRDWEHCFQCIDPNLRDARKVDFAKYSSSLSRFLDCYGGIKIWRQVNISLHMDAKRSKQDQRPFAYVYVIWQDQRHDFHMFRERWVKHDGRWHTRVVGLVAHENND